MNQNFPVKPIFTSRRMEQQWSRMQGVKMVRSGHSVDEVAKLFEVTRRAVYQWLSAFGKSGRNGL
jgi:transposase